MEQYTVTTELTRDQLFLYLPKARLDNEKLIIHIIRGSIVEFEPEEYTLKFINGAPGGVNLYFFTVFISQGERNIGLGMLKLLFMAPGVGYRAFLLTDKLESKA